MGTFGGEVYSMHILLTSAGSGTFRIALAGFLGVGSAGAGANFLGINNKTIKPIKRVNIGTERIAQPTRFNTL